MIDPKINLKDKRLVIFDLDGTLAKSKAAIDDGMAKLLEQLLEKRKVIVISGGAWPQFERQVVEHLTLSASALGNLIISTGGGSSMYRFENGEPHEMYADLLSKEEKWKILNAFEAVLPMSGYQVPTQPYGLIIEDRGSSVTFSGLGQKAPLELKEKWDPERTLRNKIITFLKERIPEFEIHTGGTTSIDVTKKDEDKSYGIRQASLRLGIPIKQILFIGDALYPGGNDAPAKSTGVDCIQVKDPEETKQVVSEIIKA